MNKEITKMFFGFEVEEKGFKKTYKEFVKEIDEFKKETLKEIKKDKEMKKDKNIYKKMYVDTLMTFLGCGLMYKNLKDEEIKYIGEELIRLGNMLLEDE